MMILVTGSGCDDNGCESDELMKVIAIIMIVRAIIMMMMRVRAMMRAMMMVRVMMMMNDSGNDDNC